VAAPYSSYVPCVRFGFQKLPLTCGFSVGDTGIEPVTSSVSGKRATAAPIARGVAYLKVLHVTCSRWVRDLNPCTRICSPLPRLSANPPWRFGSPTPSGQRDSNSRPQPWQGCALPTELCPPATTGGPEVRREH
jgi:hypothetical protein